MKFKQFLLENEKTFTPPASVATQAQKALDYKDKYGDQVDAGTSVGWTRANQLAKRKPVSLDTIERMVAFFARHKGNEKVNSKYKDEPWRDNGYVAWLLWGGDVGRDWAESISKKESENE